MIRQHHDEPGVFDHGAGDTDGGFAGVEHALAIQSARRKEDRVGPVAGDRTLGARTGEDPRLAVECAARHDHLRPRLPRETFAEQRGQMQRIGDDAAVGNQFAEAEGGRAAVNEEYRIFADQLQRPARQQPLLLSEPQLAQRKRNRRVEIRRDPPDSAMNAPRHLMLGQAVGQPPRGGGGDVQQLRHLRNRQKFPFLEQLKELFLAFASHVCRPPALLYFRFRRFQPAKLFKWTFSLFICKKTSESAAGADGKMSGGFLY